MASLDTDRWLEVDLYWFDSDDLAGSVERFWSRFARLFRDVAGVRGVVLNVGWLMDYVLDWRGSLDHRIPIATGQRTQKFLRAGTPLTGPIEQRKQKWRNRFTTLLETDEARHQHWTYDDLRRLANELRDAASNRGLGKVNVGSFVLGWERIYQGRPSAWAHHHPNAFVSGVWRERVLNPRARLRADDTRYGAYPHGLPEGIPLTEFFGAQWGHMSRAVGLDAIVLRDSVIGQGIYRRRGPYGRSAPSDPQEVSDWTRAVGDLVRATKVSNADALVLGYSSAASAVADWRVNCVDLETIAKEGYLDCWIDQTWAGAWNEVGQREHTFWNTPFLGWTYQLAYVLLHAAMLAETNVRHYHLVETFDAWESWDVIHSVPSRLRWGIWAYSHAALKSPTGLKMPAGSYISWANRGSELLSEEDVTFLAESIDAATVDAKNTCEVHGPTLVYCRGAMEWQSRHAPGQTIKEWVDEQAGSVAKWSVPILSVTRLEYLPAIRTDLPILQTPNHIPADLLAYVLRIIDEGTPVAIFGSPVGGVDEYLLAAAGVANHSDRLASTLSTIAQREGNPLRVSADVPDRFPIFHLTATTSVAHGPHVIYSVDGTPALISNLTDGRRLVLWDPAELEQYPEPGHEEQDIAPCARIGADLPIVGYLGSSYPYVLVARLLNALLSGSSCPTADQVVASVPVCVISWGVGDGSHRILVGDLEEGFVDHMEEPRTLQLDIPSSWNGTSWVVTDTWAGGFQRPVASRLGIALEHAECRLYELKPGAHFK